MIDNFYKADMQRYDEGKMAYRRSGNSSIVLPLLSLGFWWNFGGINAYSDSVAKMTYAFDHGITCFDLANNYGPPFGSAEETFGRAFIENFRPYRHEMIVTTKAGYNMWDGPYGAGSSRKMLITSLDESLRRMHLDYVDIFYSHRYDGITPLEETMQALVDIVRSGKAIYVGLSNYPADLLDRAIQYLEECHVHPLVYQGKYNMMVRDPEREHFALLARRQVGFTAFSPIAGGILSSKYLNGIPADSRIAQGHYLKPDSINPQLIARLRQLNDIAAARGQSLAQMATAWLLANPNVASVIIGPRTVDQLKDSILATHNISFSPDEIAKIEALL